MTRAEAQRPQRRVGAVAVCTFAFFGLLTFYLARGPQAHGPRHAKSCQYSASELCCNFHEKTSRNPLPTRTHLRSSAGSTSSSRLAIPTYSGPLTSPGASRPRAAARERVLRTSDPRTWASSPRAAAREVVPRFHLVRSVGMMTMASISTMSSGRQMRASMQVLAGYGLRPSPSKKALRTSLNSS